MVRVTNTCLGEDCSVRACYNVPGTTKGKFCKKCASEDMIDVQNKKCKFEKGCKKQPSFNFAGQNKALFCKKHKENGMIDIKSTKCKHSGCLKNPTRNYPGEWPALYCASPGHAPEGMVDVKNKKCEKAGCPHQPIFNYEGCSVARFCKKHQLPDMVDVCHKKCAKLGCNTRPTYNFKGKKRGVYCEKDALEGMMDVESKMCAHPDGCDVRPSYNYEGNVTGLYCELHKLDDMVSVSGTRCKCGKQAVFNYEGRKKGRCCKECASPEMVDVINKRCSKCRKLASFGLLFSSLECCAKHKTLNMVSANDRFPKCYECHVKDAYYAPPDTTYPTHCEDHYPRTYINVVEKECKSCALPFFIPEDQEMCQDCRDFANPTIRHSKELRIRAVLEANKIPITTHDEVPMYACSKKRPDFVIDCDFFFLIIEVDENQHQSYDCSCELSRMVQLHQDFGGTPVVFIRYNPDNYTDDSGRKHKGHKHNLDREKRLVNLIQKIRKKKEVFGALSAYFLYYDGDDGVNRESHIDYYGFSIKDFVEDIENQRKVPDEDSETEEE